MDSINVHEMIADEKIKQERFDWLFDEYRRLATLLGTQRVRSEIYSRREKSFLSIIEKVDEFLNHICRSSANDQAVVDNFHFEEFRMGFQKIKSELGIKSVQTF